MDTESAIRLFRIAALTVTVALCVPQAGCRRTDMRDFEVSVPSLSADKENAVRQALARFGGIDKSSIRFDYASRRIILKYDSMQLAKKNIELELAKAGFEANGVTPASVGR